MTNDLKTEISEYFTSDLTGGLGVAVSGGSDSCAILVALAEWGGAEISAVTVNHGLRAEAAGEADMVAELCQKLGLHHDILEWKDWDGEGNLMHAARDARYRLLADWARSRGIGHVALGHTQDDLAETLLMRLERGAGLDGLSAMARQIQRHGVIFHRPALGIARSDLRAFLIDRGIPWAEDPTNADPKYDRARIRKLIASFDLDTRSLAKSATYLRDARDAISKIAIDFARSHIAFDSGDVLIPVGPLRAQPGDISRRIVQGALSYVAGDGFGPRGQALTRSIAGVFAGEDLTLQGCRLVQRKDTLRVTREWQAVAEVRCCVGDVWDGRWRLEGDDAGYTIAALGEGGLAKCPDRKETGRPAASLISSPAVWDGANLVAAPLAGLHAGWTAQLLRTESEFLEGLK